MIGTPSRLALAVRHNRLPLVRIEAASRMSTSGGLLEADLIAGPTSCWTVTANPFFSSADAKEGALGRPLSISRTLAIVIPVGPPG